MVELNNFVSLFFFTLGGNVIRQLSADQLVLMFSHGSFTYAV